MKTNCMQNSAERSANRPKQLRNDAFAIAGSIHQGFGLRFPCNFIFFLAQRNLVFELVIQKSTPKRV